MPEYKIDSGEKPGTEQELKEEASKVSERTTGFAARVYYLLDRTDSIVYAVVAVCFVFTALFTLGYSFWDFVLSFFLIPDNNQPMYIANVIITLISNLLLVLIIMEVLSTVVEYLRTHVNSVNPFLFIGIISATRGILSIGARLSVGTLSLPSNEFTSSMIELGVNAGTILALGITLKLLGKT